MSAMTWSWFRQLRIWRWRLTLHSSGQAIVSLEPMAHCRNRLAEFTKRTLGVDGLCGACRITEFMRRTEPNHPTFWKEPHA